MNLIGWGLFGLSSAVPISWTYILRRAGAGALRSSSSSSSGTPKDIITMLEKRIQLDEGRRGIQEIIIQGELYRAANELLTAKRVAIITGFPCLMDFTPPTETDGPLGALAIARSLLALGKEVIIVTDECNGEPLLAAVSASGLYGPKLQLECFAGGIGYDDGEAARLKEIGQKVDVVVAIERAGPSSDGKYKTMRGFDMSHLVAPLELLFRNGEDFDENDNSTEEPVLMKRTIGIGDGGNEVGMGKIYDKILASSISKAAEIACVVPSDHLIVASVSNWGGYALAAALAVVSSSSAVSRLKLLSQCLVSSEAETVICSKLVEAGARDGISKKQELSIDGMPLEDSLRVLEDLRDIATGKLVL